MANLPKLGQGFLRQNIQVIYAVILLLLIPAAIILNSFLLIRSTQRVMDVELRQKVLLAAKVASASLRDRLDDPDQLKTELERLAQENDELRAIDVLVPEGDAFTIVASLDPTVVGTTSRYVYNTLARQAGQPIAFTTVSPRRTTEEQRVTSLESAAERYWVVVNPVLVDDSTKALVSMKVSSKVIDDLTKKNLNNTSIALGATVLVVILLLINNTRLFQYALLFKKLKEVDAMKDEFISMASHELRTPITGIKGYLQMLLSGEFGSLTDEVKKPLVTVSEAARRLDELVADLLDVSRIEQGRVKLMIKPIDLVQSINGTITELQPTATDKGLQLTYGAGAEAVPLVLADVNKLKQTLVNLIGNAVKYTKQGSVKVTAGLKEKVVELKVSDTGVGMSPEARERLFTKFYRIQTTETAGISGTGLGLWITKQLIEMMGGKIFVDSIEGKGTQVTVHLPVAPPERK